MAEQPVTEMTSSLGESWTVITDKNLEATSTPGCSLHSEGSHVEEVLLDKKSEDRFIKKLKEEVVLQDPPSSRSSNSDIAVIDEEEEREKTPPSVDGSQLSGESLFSFLTLSTASKNSIFQQKGDFEALGEDLSDISSVTSHIREELNSEVDFNPGAKHYVHVPNARLNLALNMVVVLAVTAVLGLGVGNFIGWSTMQQRFHGSPPAEEKILAPAQDHWQPTPTQALKLKKLQNELVLCIEQQKDSGSKICLQDVQYWKAQFAQLFEENQDLQQNLRDTQVRGDESDLILEKTRCPNQAKGDFQNLKLDLLIDQMDHLQLLKNYEEIRQQEKLSKEKLKKLEEENEELKIKLVEEEEEDVVMLNDLEGKIQKLRDENEGLKVKLQAEEEQDSKQGSGTFIQGQILTTLEEQVQGLRDENRELKNVLQNLQVEEKLDHVASSRMDVLKEQIDEVFAENQEMRNLIKSMQEKRVMDKVSLNDQQKLYVNELKHENEDLKVEIGKMRYKNFAPSETPELDAEDPDIISMQEQLNKLQDILQQEKGEVEKWKQMYEDMKKKSSTPNDQDEKKRSSRQEKHQQFPNIDWADVVAKLNVPDLTDKLGNMGTAVSQILQDIWKMNESMGQQFKDVQRDLYSKWEELRVQMEENLQAKGTPEKEQKTNKKEEKMSEILLNSMKKLYRSGVKFMFSAASKVEDGGNRAGKLMDSFKKIMGKLNNKWTTFKDAVAKSVEEPVEEPEVPENESTDDMTVDPEQYESDYESAIDNESPNDDWYSRRMFDNSDSNYEADNEESELDQAWYLKRAESREKYHGDAPDSKFTDWDLKRAKGRKRQREMIQSDDDGETNSEEDDDDEEEDEYEIKRGMAEKRYKDKKKDVQNGGEKMVKGRREQKAKRGSKKKENGRKKKEKFQRNGS